MVKEQGGSVLIGCVENTDSKFFRDSWSRWERTLLTVKLFVVSSEVLSPTSQCVSHTLFLGGMDVNHHFARWM